MTSPLLRIYRRIADLLPRHFLAFGIVGFCGYLIDVGIFNLLRLELLGDHGFVASPIGAKIISVAIATVATWLGNRYFAFRDQRRANVALELVEFSVIAVTGNGIALLCLWVSHYVLGFTSLLADNVATNVIGLILATAFRFVLYRVWVYGPNRRDSLARIRAAESPESADGKGEDNPLG